MIAAGEHNDELLSSSGQKRCREDEKGQSWNSSVSIGVAMPSSINTCNNAISNLQNITQYLLRGFFVAKYPFWPTYAK